MRGQQIYTVIQAVHSLLYIVEKFHFFSVVTWKDIIKYLQNVSGSHFCEIIYIYERERERERERREEKRERERRERERDLFVKTAYKKYCKPVYCEIGNLI